MTELEIKLPDLSRVALEPGDMLLLRCPKPITQHEADRLKESLAEYLPGHEVIIMTGGLELSVVRPVETADAPD